MGLDQDAPPPDSWPAAIERLTRADRQRLTGPGLRAFFRLAEVWRLSAEEQMMLLGVSSRSTLRRWRRGVGTGLRKATLERLSLLFGIFKAINSLFVSSARADNWIRAPNKHPLFGGRSAIGVMATGRIEDLYCVSDYLGSHIAPPL